MARQVDLDSSDQELIEAPQGIDEANESQQIIQRWYNNWVDAQRKAGEPPSRISQKRFSVLHRLNANSFTRWINGEPISFESCVLLAQMLPKETADRLYRANHFEPVYVVKEPDLRLLLDHFRLADQEDFKNFMAAFKETLQKSGVDYADYYDKPKRKRGKDSGE